MSIATRSCAVLLAAFVFAPAIQAGSIRFFGTGSNDVDRVKIRIDDPATNVPGPPADIGAGAFTIEFWVKGNTTDNNNSVRCGAGVYGWIDGDIIIDRDRFNQNRSWGLAFGGGRVAFGASDANGSIATVCGSTVVLNNQWRHVAVTRAANGTISIFVDGTLDQSAAGPSGDLSYPDNGQPGNFCNGPCTNSDPFIVLGAEKHDALPGQLAFNGFMDELRLSNSVRYSGSFTPSTVPLTADGSTVALYHFDEATTGNCDTGTVINDADGGASNGVCRFGGSPGGPVFSTDSPFAAVPSAGMLQFSPDSVAVDESAGSATLNVARTGGTSGAVSVSYATANGTATAGADYTTTSGTLNWANGDGASKSIAVPVANDTAPEPDETFTVSLSAPTGGATLGTALATVTIDDNDSTGTLRFSAASYPAAEGSPTIVITVARANGSAGVATVQYSTNDGTALQGQDYTAASGTLQWNAGETGGKPFNVAITDDSQIESAETFSVTLSNASGATLGSPSTATVTIADNDSAPAPGTLQFTQSSFTAGESAGTLTLTVSRVNGTAGAASVRITSASGSATAGSDFQALDQTLTWAAGEGGNQTATLTITNDTTDEADENLTVTLTNAMGATLGSPATATVTIGDDDTAPPPPPSNSDSGGGGSLELVFALLLLILLAAKSDAVHFRRRPRGLARRL